MEMGLYVNNNLFLNERDQSLSTELDTLSPNLANCCPPNAIQNAKRNPDPDPSNSLLEGSSVMNIVCYHRWMFNISSGAIQGRGINK